MTLEQKIRALARRKVKIKITGRVKSRTGFEILGVPTPIGQTRCTTRTKQEGLQLLYALLRCADDRVIELRIAK